MLEHYLRSVGAATVKEIVRLFGWEPTVLHHELKKLEEAGVITTQVDVEEQKGEWVMHQALG
jgi:predicted transcriptional regulator